MHMSHPSRPVYAGCSQVGSAAKCMAPEVVGTVLDPAETPVSPAIDVWAVGTILYWLLADRPLFGNRPCSTSATAEVTGSGTAQSATHDKPAKPAELEANVAAAEQDQGKGCEEDALRAWELMLAEEGVVKEQQNDWVRLHAHTLVLSVSA